VRFLVDENLPPRLAKLLAASGHDAVHVRDLAAASAPDSAIMALAADQDRVIVSADTDFGALLAQARATRPSVILVREIMSLHPAELASVILGQLEILEPHFRTGAIAAITATGIRVRALPLR
jgi:predicted nuclease of predicted toxin-antitoxin system